MSTQNKQVIVAGAGPVGCTAACILAKKGFKVKLYELRSDIRTAELVSGRSINLALSVRGISALKHIGIAEKVIKLGVPMHARMIHMPNSKTYPIPYGKEGQYLLSTDRILLNQMLLTAAEQETNVEIFFEHKLTRCDPKLATASFTRKDQSTVSDEAAALIGCDGAYSAVRRSVMRTRFNYSQSFIDHGYMELNIPPTQDGEYAMPPNYLHIWPRHEFMLIALPNLDKSFTVTLFMEFKSFDTLKDGGDVVQFFEETFPDALNLIGERNLITDYFSLPPLPLITVKCTPHHSGKTVLLGDAAHALVPFFGQGLNAGLEDALIFSETIVTCNNNIDKAIEVYSLNHYKDGHAIADLSLRNYLEMRSDVASLGFLFRKKVDNFLNRILPQYFIPRYTMVTFTRMKYHNVKLKADYQDKVISIGLVVIGLLVSILFLLIMKYLYKTEGGSHSYL